MKTALDHPHRSFRGWQLVSYAVVVVAAVTAFLAVLASIGEHDYLASWDQPILLFAVAHRTAALTLFFTAVTNIGSGVGLFAIAAAVCALVCWRRRSAWPAILVLVTVLGSVAFNNSVKNLVHRDRPSAGYWLAQPGGYAYPSGHAMNSAATYGILAYVTFQLVSALWAKIAIVVTSTVLALAIGASRIYLGVHWFTDVIGGFLAGLGWMTLVILALRVWILTRNRVPSPDAA
jgi:membrane-associated phospholipid phosphatase